MVSLSRKGRAWQKIKPVRKLWYCHNRFNLSCQLEDWEYSPMSYPRAKSCRYCVLWCGLVSYLSSERNVAWGERRPICGINTHSLKKNNTIGYKTNKAATLPHSVIQSGMKMVPKQGTLKKNQKRFVTHCRYDSVEECDFLLLVENWL